MNNVPTTEMLPNEDALQQIEETMENEQDDWFIQAIIDQNQPEFWWVY
jgi:hypothetical protein